MGHGFEYTPSCILFPVASALLPPLPPPATPSRRFLFVTTEADSADLAWQIRKEGNEVRFYVRDPSEQDTGDGFLEKTDDWLGLVEWADVIVFDDTGFGAEADQLRSQGKAVVGGSVYTDRLELDREFGQEEMRSVGMTVLPHWDFTNFNAAIQFLREHPGRYVFKPSGVEVNNDWALKSLLMIGQEEDGRDILEALQHNRKTWSRKLRSFQLQKYVAGVEIAVGAFFNGTDFVTPININFEHKKLFPGDIGPQTGEMGTLMFWSDPNKFFTGTLGRMQQKLAASGYRGYVDINCIANARGVYPLEFTTRFGYPTISIQMEGVLSRWSDVLAALGRGEAFDFKTKRGFQVGVVVAAPPFPFYDQNLFAIYKDTSVLFKKPLYDGIHLGGVKFVDGDWRIAGESCYVLVVTGSNTTVDGARQQAYRRIDNIMLQNMFYRTDIGLKWAEESDKLHAWGVL